MNFCELPLKRIASDLNFIGFKCDESVKITAVNGGISKKTYIIDTNSIKVVLHIWLNPHPELTSTVVPDVEILYQEGAAYMEYNNKLLTALGIRVPQFYYGNKYEGEGQCFEYAYVEYLYGQNLDEYLKDHPFDSVYGNIIGILIKLHNVKSHSIGSDLIGKQTRRACYDICYDFAQKELELAAGFNESVKLMQDKISKRLNDLKSRLQKRHEYSLIHSELSPHHIFILESGETAVIDIENVKFWDIEYEYALLMQIYGQNGKYFESDHLDVDRVQFYRLFHLISWISASAEMAVKNRNSFFEQFMKDKIMDLMKLLS